MLFSVFIPHKNTPISELIKDAAENGKHYKELHLRRIQKTKQPNNVLINIEFIESLEFIMEEESIRQFSDEFPSSNPTVQKISERYLYALRGDTNYFDSLELNSKTTAPYDHYILGTLSMKNGHLKDAVSHFKLEIEKSPSFEKSYQRIYEIYKYSPDKLETFLRDWRNTLHLNPHIVRRESYNLGLIIPYLRAAYSSFFTTSFFAVIAALTISFIWLLFLRGLDIYNREKWRDLIFVFLLGALFTNLCLYIYDLAHYNYGLRITGNGLNDFLYCTFVIGGAEELVKFLPWLLFGLFSRKLKEPYDYILYASAASLGFAFTENLMYLQESENIIARTLTSTIGHMFWGSIIAYTFILMRFKYSSKNIKYLLPIAGILLAMLAHGFYDYWLISPAANKYSLITMIFLILSLHLWIFLINNAVNNSPFYVKKIFNSEKHLEILTISIIGIFMLAYSILAYRYGARYANHSITKSSILVAGFLFYMNFLLTNFKLEKGLWKKYKFVMPTFVSQFVSIPDYNRFEKHDFSHFRLSLFAPKTNKYVGSRLPIEGICIEPVIVNNDPTWYRFQFDRPLEYPNYRSNEVLIHPKKQEQSFYDDKIEIYMMLIPDEIKSFEPDLEMNQLRYTGRVYSRPKTL